MYKERLHKSGTLFSLRNKNRRRENHSGRTTCFLVLSGDHDVLFRGRFQERRDATRRRENASPKKSIILLVSQACARARESAREIFLAMTEVYQARLSHVGSPAGASAVCARSNYILLCLSTTHLSTRTRCSFSSSSFSPFLLLLPFSRAALPLARGSSASRSPSAAGDDWTCAKSNTIAR